MYITTLRKLASQTIHFRGLSQVSSPYYLLYVLQSFFTILITVCATQVSSPYYLLYVLQSFFTVLLTVCVTKVSSPYYLLYVLQSFFTVVLIVCATQVSSPYYLLYVLHKCRTSTVSHQCHFVQVTFVVKSHVSNHFPEVSRFNNFSTVQVRTFTSKVLQFLSSFSQVSHLNVSPQSKCACASLVNYAR